MAIKRVLTGIRPTGPLHLGHYLGALKQWIPLQEEYECFFMIADVQALTTHVDRPELIEESVREVLLDWLGVGLDPTRKNVHFVLQSGVLELTELTTYLEMLVPFSEMERNPTIKAEKSDMEKRGKSPTAGFMVYPISQAADILLFTPYPPQKGDKLIVPVGDDQIPHLEGTNRVARRFNNQYGKVLLECTAEIGDVGRLVGTDGNAKMSKSLGNIISLKDDAETVQIIISKMFTDETKKYKNDPGHPEKCPVFTYHKSFGDQNSLNEKPARCENGSLGCVECKKDLTNSVNSFLDPIRTRRKAAENAPLSVYLQEGTQKARKVGQKTMEAIRRAMHLDYPSVFRK